MKKFLKVIIPVLITFFIIGCSNQAESTPTQTNKYVFEEKGVKNELTYTYKEDNVLKQSSVTTISLKEIGATQEQFKEVMEPESKKFEGITGIDYKIEYSDDIVIETLNADYEKLDFEKAKNLPGSIFSGDAKNGVSMKVSEEMLLKEGYKKVE